MWDEAFDPPPSTESESFPVAEKNSARPAKDGDGATKKRAEKKTMAENLPLKIGAVVTAIF
jgi:hypothetical protein